MAARLLVLACTAAALNRPRIARLRPSTALRATRQATLGLGCFWAPSEELLGVEGVVDTRCGYAGAVFPDARPSYASVCGGDGNVEAVQVTYDDAVVSYEAVLDAAFAASKPVLGSRQYAPIVFASDGDEAARAAAWVGLGGVRDDGLERRQFAVEETDTFWLAESYHQEYWQKWRPRYALLAALVAVQFGDTLGRTGDDICTALVCALGVLAVVERFFGDVEAGSMA